MPASRISFRRSSRQGRRTSSASLTLESLERRELLTASPSDASLISPKECSAEPLAVADASALEVPFVAQDGLVAKSGNGKGSGKGQGGGGGPTGGVLVAPYRYHQTDENGAQSTFDVVLESQPTDTVTIPLSVSDPSEGAIDKTSLVFTPENWDVPQTVTITGLHDVDLPDVPDVPYLVETGDVTSNDDAYDRLTAADVVDVEVVNLDVDDGLTNDIYIRDFWVETGTLGKHTTHRFYVVVAFDTNKNGLADADDQVAAQANVFVSLYDDLRTDPNTSTNIRNFLTNFDEAIGAHRTSGIKGLASGTYYAEINDLYFDGYFWDPDGALQLSASAVSDADGDGHPDFSFDVP